MLAIVAVAVVAAAAYWLGSAWFVDQIGRGGSADLVSIFLGDTTNLTPAQLTAALDQFVWRRVVVGLPLTWLFYWLLWRIVSAGLRLPAQAFFVNSPHSLRGNTVQPLLALGLYASITVAMFFPCLDELSTHLIGPAGDNMQLYWTLWWSRASIAQEGSSLGFTSSIFYPEGTTLYFHTLSFFNVALALVFNQFISLPAAYNLLILLTYPLAGLGGYLLTYYFARDRWAALIGGFLFAFSPYHFARSLNHLNLASIQFLPFLVLYMVKAIRREGKWSVPLAAFFFLLNAACDWYYMIFAVILILLGYLYLAFRNRRLILGRYLWVAAITIIVPIAVLSPWLIGMIEIALQSPQIAGTGHGVFVADLAGFVVPDNSHPLSQLAFIGSATATFTGSPYEKVCYLGLVALGLLVVCRNHLHGAGAKMLLGALAFMTLSLGATCRIFGVELPIITPGQLLQYVPFISFVRSPVRYVVIAHLFLAVAVGIGIAARRSLATIAGRQLLLLLLVVSLLFVDYFRICYETTAVAAPICYDKIPVADRGAPILDLPRNYVNVNRYMMYQTSHHHPLIDGYVARKVGPASIETIDFRNLQNQKRQLAALGVKYIVLHKYLLDPGDEAYLVRYQMHYQTIYEDIRNIVLQI